MAKTKTIFVCKNCGANSLKWVGRCNSCGEWNTYVEEIETKSQKQSVVSEIIGTKSQRPKKIEEIDDQKLERITLENREFNRVLGGGIVPGSMILLGGEPGIGKSTLSLQIAVELNDKKVLYISGEESLEQLKMRAERLGYLKSDCLFLSETRLEQVLLHIKNETPDLLILDSIQTLFTEKIESSPGSIVQIRECTSILLKNIKPLGIPTILIGHINKEGSIAGPKILEHMVDTVLQFEGDRNNLYRILRSLKNRFGSTAEMGIYQMQGDGLHEVENPSEMLLSNSQTNLSGTAVAATTEGVRSFMIEVQALVSSSAYGNPQRTATGFDLRRLNMLLAVLEKRAGFKVMAKDVFINIAGGIKVDDPALDLTVIIAILSSNFDFPIHKQICFAGEIALTGEIRPVSRIEQRIGEAEKLGFRRIYVSRYNKIMGKDKFGIEIYPVEEIGQIIRHLFTQNRNS